MHLSCDIFFFSFIAQMFSKLAVFGLVAFATAADVIVSEGDDEGVEEAGAWAESSSVLSVQTLMMSNSSAVVQPSECKAHCPCCTPKIVSHAACLALASLDLHYTTPHPRSTTMLMACPWPPALDH